MATDKPALVKRFYKSVSLLKGDVGYGLTLDGRVAKTPARHPLTIPTSPLAQAMIAEWDSQEEFIDFSTMPMTGYQMTIIDSASHEHETWRREIIRFLTSDLVCYRAENPAELVARQTRIWDPLLTLLAQHLDFKLNVTSGILFVDQSSDDLAKGSDYVVGLSTPNLLAARRISELTKSAVLGLLGAGGYIDSERTVEAAYLDEVFQSEKWGEDAQASARLDAIQAEIIDAFRFLALIK